MTEKILIIFALFLVFSSLTFSQVFSETIHTFEYTKIGCDMLAIDQIQSVLEEKKWIKTTLAECVERGLITSELVELGATVWGHSTRELSIVYGLTHGDIEKTIQLLQDPNYPINVFGSPYKQVSIGIEPENVLCKDGLVLIQKYDGSPACVTESTKLKLIERGWTTKDDSVLLKINTGCMTIEQSKQTAPFFKTPTYLPEGYSYVCSQSGTPSESYVVYHNKEVSVGWIGKLHLLIDEGAIFIHQIDEKNMIGDKKFQTYGSPEQRTRETYDSVIEGNPSLNPQLITINGMLAYAVDSCNYCGTQTANFTDGTVIQKSTSSETRIKFYDENGVSYMLETTLPLSELIKVAESLQ